MDTGLQLFSFQNQNLRSVLIGGEPWFVVSDVCRILDISNPSQAVQPVHKDDKLLYAMYIAGQNRQTLLVNESGVYRLVFASRKEEALNFQRWVTKDVIPSIRKTGSYSVLPAVQPSPIPFNKSVQRRCIANEGILPNGYWCVVNEMYKEALIIVAFQKELKDWALPDGSCGKKWRNYGKNAGLDFSKSKKWSLWVPNLISPAGVWIYPIDEILEKFRPWLRVEYADYYENSYSPSRLVDAPQIESSKKKGRLT
jgi:hypothetical protein